MEGLDAFAEEIEQRERESMLSKSKDQARARN